MFKKIKLPLYFFLVTILAGVGCKKADLVTPPSLSEFINTSVGSYSILDDANSVFKIPVGVTTVSNVERNITFTISSPTGAAEGSQYTVASKTLTIPAGKAIDTILLKGLFAGFPTGRTDTLIFQITGGDVPAFTGRDVYKVVLRKFCPLNIGVFAGDFVVLKDEWEDFAPGDIVKLTAIDDSHFSFINPHAVSATPKPVIVTVNRSNNQVTIPRTIIGTAWTWNATYTGPAMATVGAAGASFLATCDETVTFNLQYSVDQGTFPNTFLLVLKKKR